MNIMNNIFLSQVNNIDVTYDGNFLDKNDANNYYNIFEQHLKYNSDESSKVTVFGKKHTIPRKQVAYGVSGLTYTFAGVTVDAIPWDGDDLVCNTIMAIKNKVELATGVTFNFALINRYKDGNDYIGAHRDDEKDLDGNIAIAGVSLGAVRSFVFKPYKFIPIPENNNDKFPINKETLKCDLGHGSLCVMQGNTNKYWTHQIPKSSKVKNPRINITFRRMVKLL